MAQTKDPWDLSSIVQRRNLNAELLEDKGRDRQVEVGVYCPPHLV